MLITTTLLGALGAACLWPTDAPPAAQDPAVLVSPQATQDATLPVTADTYLRSGEPNQNFGTDAILRVRPTGKNRALLQVDSAALAAAMGGGTLTAARLELTITHNADNWGPSGRALALHRLTVPWSETGATWNCGVDTVPGNPQAECAAGTAWEMGTAGPNPWVEPASATTTITNGQTGVVTLDVTGDVAAWLSGGVNAGWLLKREDEGPSGAVEFGSREGGAPPVLVLTVDADTGRPAIPDGFTSPDSAVALLVSPPGQPDVLVLRDFIHIEFDDTTSGAGVRAVFDKYNAEIVGGYPLAGTYIVRIPDPGATYAALDSVLKEIRAEPGVASAYRRVKQEPDENLSRYPSDGPGGQRQDWFGAGTDATRALNAIRAPLAWGCETGLYATPPSLVGVGVIDNVFDTSLPDFSTSSKTVYPVVGEILNPAVIEPEILSHGTGVTGVITARGDNGTATAGLVWGADLHLFRLAREVGGVTRRVEDRGSYIANVVLVAARNAPIRILHSSITARSEPEVSRRIAFRIAQFVNAGAGGRLFVQASGNDLVTFSPSQADTMTQGGFLMQQAVVRMRGTPPADRVLLVGAANRDGTARWTDPQNPQRGGTLWTGVTAILSPGEDVLMLARPVDFPAGTVTQDGSSVAAPMVSGVAAQLLAFYPDLTADEIKAYILKGAEQRIDARGTIVSRTPVQSTGGLHLLDAYGALQHVAREKHDSPVCGFPVYTRDGALRFERTPGTPLPVPIDGVTDVWGRVAVAQGGRRLAVAADDGWVQFDHQGHAVMAVPADVLSRFYLEQDTADLLLPVHVDSSIRAVRIRRRDGSATTIDLQSVLAPAATRFRAIEVQPSPFGDWLGVNATWDLPGGPPFTSVFQWSIVPTGGSDPTPVLTLTFTAQAEGATPFGEMPGPWAEVAEAEADPFPCGPDCFLWLVEPGSMAWAHDNSRLQFTFLKGSYDAQTVTIERSVMRSVTFPGGTPTGQTTDLGSMPGVEYLWPRFTVEGDFELNERNLTTGDCLSARRDPVTGQPITSAPTAAADCDRLQDPRRRFNGAPVAGRTPPGRR